MQSARLLRQVVRPEQDFLHLCACSCLNDHARSDALTIARRTDKINLQVVVAIVEAVSIDCRGLAVGCDQYVNTTIVVIVCAKDAAALVIVVNTQCYRLFGKSSVPLRQKQSRRIVKKHEKWVRCVGIE